MEKNNEFVTNLDNILLSQDARKLFYEYYTNNSDFRETLDRTLPEISLCEKQEQKTPWHIYNVLDHTLHSVSNVNKLSKDKDFQDKRMLAYTLFLHDIGKPLVRRTVVVGGHEYDSFKGHNIESCKIAARTLPELNFTQKESNEILELIEKHDIFAYVSDRDSNVQNKIKLDKSFILKLKQDMSKSGDPEKLSEFLGLVAKADNLAQNPELTGEPIRIIDKYSRMLEAEKKFENQDESEFGSE